MFKLALNAGHSYTTAGKRCLKTIDPEETREYVLNKRICDKIEQKLKNFDGIEILRIDDETEIPLKKRTDTANSFGADFYLAVHHNAGINGGSGGGIEAYTYIDVNEPTRSWQAQLYGALIAATGLVGNRSRPLRTADFAELRDTKMPAVLLELGFMDSTSDTPVILTEGFAESAATACAQVIAERSGATPLPEKTIEPNAMPAEEIAKQVVEGKWGNGDERKTRLTAAGYNYTEIQSAVNALLGTKKAKKSAKQLAQEVIEGKWGNGTERKARLKADGYNYSAVQKEVNKILKGGR